MDSYPNSFIYSSKSFLASLAASFFDLEYTPGSQTISAKSTSNALATLRRVSRVMFLGVVADSNAATYRFDTDNLSAKPSCVNPTRFLQVLRFFDIRFLSTVKFIFAPTHLILSRFSGTTRCSDKFISNVVISSSYLFNSRYKQGKFVLHVGQFSDFKRKNNQNVIDFALIAGKQTWKKAYFYWQSYFT